MNTTSTAATMTDLLALGTARAMADGHSFDTALHLALQAMADTNPEALRAFAATR